MNILLPIETINREIDFKIALAGFLSGKGHKIFIGQHDLLMKLVPLLKEGGIYIGKNIFTKRANIEKGEKYYFLKENNFDIIYLHEEGAVFPGTEESWTTILESQYNLNFFDKDDVVCVWGDFQKRHDESLTTKVAIYTTGHPRMDLCKKKWHSMYQTKVDALTKTYSNFILINGNYGIANHGLGLQHVFSDRGDYNVENESERMNRINFFSHSSRQLISMIQLTHQLAIRFPNLNFVFRPHPSENHNYYKTIFSGVKNIFVNHDGPILPWIIASKLIIHEGCTTAVEATLAEKQVINFKTENNPAYDIWLPNQLGIKVDTIDNVIHTIQKIIEDNYSIDAKNYENTKISDLIYNFKGDSFDALLQIIDQKIASKTNKLNSNLSKFQIRNVYLKSKIKINLYKILKPGKKSHIKYHNTKFYGFSKEDLMGKVIEIEKILNKKIRIQYHNSHLIEIE